MQQQKSSLFCSVFALGNTLVFTLLQSYPDVSLPGPIQVILLPIFKLLLVLVHQICWCQSQGDGGSRMDRSQQVRPAETTVQDVSLILKSLNLKVQGKLQGILRIIEFYQASLER